MTKRAKIIATIGPSCSEYNTLLRLVEEGVDVCRINFSHGDRATQQQIVDNIHRLNKETQRHIALLGDLQGPKIRIGNIENESVAIEVGQTIIITTENCMGTATKVSTDYTFFPSEVKVNHRLLIDDGKLELRVIKIISDKEIEAEVIHGGLLKSRKGINLPDTKVSQSSLSDKDKADLAFIMENRFQWIALSFVRSAADIEELRACMATFNKKKNPFVIAKIEKPEALCQIDKIVQVSDGIMIARGDLGIEVPMETLPLIQKKIIRKCLKAAKPIIVATQMMESMITSYTPTRAEVNDVANSVMDGADAVMLSAETSVGSYPIDVIKMVHRIITSVESFDGIYNRFGAPSEKTGERYITDTLCHNACVTAAQMHAKALTGMTHSGYTAVKISSYRPASAIFVFTSNHDILSKLSLVWGVKGFYYNNFESSDKTIEDLKKYLAEKQLLSSGDLVIHLISMPINQKGMINTMRISRM